MKVTPTPLPGVVVIEPRVFADERGFFVETFQAERYREQAGISAPFVQDNHSRSRRDVLRGLHLQLKHPQGKLVRAASGSIWDVAVDVDSRSPTFKQWFGIELNDQNHRQLYIPPGFAHGFVVLSETADFAYKCTELYYPDDESGVLWNDEELAITWPVANPVISKRDAGNMRLKDFVLMTSG